MAQISSLNVENAIICSGKVEKHIVIIPVPGITYAPLTYIISYDIQNKPIMVVEIILILQIRGWSFKDLQKIVKFSYLGS